MSLSVTRGDLLISAITLTDDNFTHTVVLLCEHSEEHGTYGLVLNRPVSTGQELLEEYPFLDGRLFQGGPVQKQVLQVLHPYGDTLSESHQVLPGVWLGGDLDQLQSGFASGLYDPDACRFFLGYSGWSRGQLASELELNAWVTVHGSADLVLHTKPRQIWARAVRLSADDNPIYKHFPESPMWN